MKVKIYVEHDELLGGDWNPIRPCAFALWFDPKKETPEYIVAQFKQLLESEEYGKWLKDEGRNT